MIVQDGAGWRRWLAAVDQHPAIHILDWANAKQDLGPSYHKPWQSLPYMLLIDLVSVGEGLIDLVVSVGEGHHEATKLAKGRRSEKGKSTPQLVISKKAATICLWLYWWCYLWTWQCTTQAMMMLVVG